MNGTVLHLIDTGGPGGAETIFLELVQRLAHHGWRSVAVLPCRDWLYDALAERSIEPVLLRSRRSFDGAYLMRLLSIARSAGAALIQTHLFSTAVYGSAAGRLRRLPVVSTLHGVVDLPPRDRFRRLKTRVLMRPTNRIVFVSEALRREVLGRTQLPPALTRVVPNGIDLAAFRPVRTGALRASLRIGAGEVLIGAVGNVRESKDYANLLHAAAWLRERGATYRFIIAGDTRGGPLYERLLALRSELRLEHMVEFIGFQRDVPQVLNDLDVYVLSSDREGFSLTTVQAMACGVPVVATRCGGPEEIVTDGHDGVLVPRSDPVALGGALQSLVADPARRARLAAAGKRTAHERFGMDAMIGGYDRIYRELLRVPSPSRPSAPADVVHRARIGLP